jgi:exodeoxyribonuclease VII large subunit
MSANPRIAVPKPEESKGVTLSALLGQIKGIINSGLPEPVWVRAEIRQLRTPPSGIAYLELEERGPDGRAVASTSAVIWADKLRTLQAKFTAGTGGGLQPDMKVLVLVRPDLAPAYGFRLMIEDIDPSFTVGDLLARIEAIRAKLRADGQFDLNRMLPAPVNFFRVAVISPSLSAGHGDFRSEAERLQNAGLCAFDYFTAVFQGTEAPKSIQQAMRATHERHLVEPYDALAIIRGGGSGTDLAWLNDLVLARWVCRIPIPVFTGIGHERDSTVLDDVAHRRFDTPSKVALHISQTILQNALETMRYVEQINEITGRAMVRQTNVIQSLRDRVVDGSQRSITSARTEMDSRVQQVRLSARHRCREAEVAFETAKVRLVDGASARLRDAVAGSDNALDAVRSRSKATLTGWSGRTDAILREIATRAEALTAAAGANLGNIRQRIGTTIESSMKTARLQMNHCIERIVSLGPEATLKRGYAIARDADGRPVGSAAEARAHTELTIQFRDGDVASRIPQARREHGDERRNGAGPRKFQQELRDTEADRRLAVQAGGAGHRPARAQGRTGDAGLRHLQGAARHGAADAWEVSGTG